MQAGNFSGSIAVITDLTERQQLEQSQRATHDQALLAFCDADEDELAGSAATVDIYSWLDAHLSTTIGQGRRLASGRPSIDYHMVV